MAVITISRELGSGGTYIALKLAQIISGVCLDKEIINEIARKMGKSESELHDFDQETYSRISVFFQEALASIAEGGRVFHPFGIGSLDWEGLEVFSSFPDKEFRHDQYVEVLKAVITEMATKTADTVFLGRGGSQILKNFPGALHVRIVACMSDRMERIMKEQGADEEKARSLIEQRDASAAKFIYDFFDEDWADPHLYHLTLNTSMISFDSCIETIMQFLKARSEGQ